MARRPPANWFPRRSEVYWVALPGAKRRPAIVLSTDALNRYARDVCVVPLTSVQHAEFSLRVPVPKGEAGLGRDSWAKCDQVHTVEKRALVYPPLGRLPAKRMAEVEAALRRTLEL